MFKKILKTINFAAVAFLIIVFSSPAYSDEYPEFVGNYIKKDGEWQELGNFKLDIMTLSGDFHAEGNGYIAYTGLFNPPASKIIKVKDKKPRIFLFTGRQQSDPSTVALVELSKLPYNNIKVSDMNKKHYDKQMLNYCKENINSEMWVFKREVPLRFKPIDGKIGGNMFEPAEPLTDGLYAIDSGFPKNGMHTKLRLEPVKGITIVPIKQNDYGKIGALVFVVGDVKFDEPAEANSTDNSDVSGSKQETVGENSQKSEKNLGKELVDSVFKGLFKQ